MLRIFTLNARLVDLAYFCGLWFFLDPVLNLMRRQLGLQVGFEFLFITGYIGYYVLGHLLSKLPLTKQWLIGAALCLLAAFGFVFYSVYVGQQAPDYDQFFEGYLSVPVVLMTASAFIFTRALGPALGTRVSGWIRPLSGASLGVYLLHVLVLDVFGMTLAPLVGDAGWGSSIWMMPLTAVAGLLVCWLVVLVLQRIPVVKYAVP